MGIAANGDLRESLVVCRNSQGVEFSASLLRLTRFVAAFEIYNPAVVVRMSEVLSDFRIVYNDRTLYSGKAVVSNLVNVGTVLVCEAKLDETGLNLAAFAGADTKSLCEGFHAFLGEWQKVYKVLPEFKVVVADMQTFLADLRLWLDQVELEIRCAPSGDRVEQERLAAQQLGGSIVPAFDAMHERLEELSDKIEPEWRPAHQAFSKRQLHPLMLCSPFAYRTFQKPLGYAGDYEMVNMIIRDPHEGGSLFAKVVNLWFLSQWPAKAHRNRITYLKDQLIAESLRGARRAKPIRVLNLGCGPAGEIEHFLAADSVADHADLTLLDFNDETIQHTTRVLGELRRRLGRRTPIQVLKKSVHQVLKEGQKPVVAGAATQYDYIYCAGLFDYLSDRTCRQLMNIFYDWLSPGGLLVATNVDACKPFRNMLEFVLDWHLIYRDAKTAALIFPDRSSPELQSIKKDSTGVNVFLEVRKPDHV